MAFRIDVFARAGDWLGEWFRSLSTFEVERPSEMMTVGWIGGPFDGLCREVEAADVWHLPTLIEIPISRTQLEPSERLSLRYFDMPTSIAIYHLDFHGERWFYRFVEAGPVPNSSLAP